MKVILVGASGRIGKAIDSLLSPEHEIVRVGATSGDIQCGYIGCELGSRNVSAGCGLRCADLFCGKG